MRLFFGSNILAMLRVSIHAPAWGATPRIALLARQYAAQALQGLLDDGRARAVEVSAEQPHDGRCLLHVTVTDATGQRYSYEHFVPVGA